MSDVLATISNNANSLTARLLTEEQALSIRLQPAYYMGSAARDVELAGHNGALRLKITKTLGVFSTAMQSGTQMPNIYWPWVICTTGRITNPLGKYYMYYSGDHIYESGWISMAYSNDLLSGWTDYGKVFRNYIDLENQTTPKESETPSVVWNEENREFIMYFQSRETYTGEAQTSWYVTSPDGIHWSNRTKMLDIDPTRVPGNAHNGYAHPFEYYGTLFAYTLMGGGNGGTALSYSLDGGYHWTTVHRLLGRWCLDVNGNSLYAHHGTVVHLNGMDFWIGIMQNFASGTQPKVARIVMVPMAELTRPFGRPVVLFTPTDATREGDNLRSFSVFQEGNKLYLFYHCCVGSDNHFNVAVMEATTAAPVAATLSFTVRPANVSVTAGSIAGSLSALAVASDGSAVTYQWYSNTSVGNTGGTPIASANGTSMAIPTSLEEGAYFYYCVASSVTAGTIASAAATVTVAAAPATPTIAFSIQPANASVMAGNITGSLTVLAVSSDASPISYQWYSNTDASVTGGTIIPGATGASFAIPTTLAEGNYFYHCVATSATAGSVMSVVAMVTVAAAPLTESVSFTTQPQSVRVYAGSVVGLLTVVASASDGSAVAYQWYSNSSETNTGGAVISGANSNILSVPIAITQTAHYYCVATSGTAGSATSNAVTVTVKTLTDLANYTLTGTPGDPAPASIADDTGNGNTLTVNGMTEYGVSGGMPGGLVNQSLYLPSLNLQGHTSYVLFMEYRNTGGVVGQHRMFECVTDALGLQISSNNCNGKMRWETSGSAFASPHDSPSVTLVGNRNIWEIERLVVRVYDDVLTATMQIRDPGSVEIIQTAFSATGFTAALTSGVYFLNRAAGDRPFPGAMSAMRVGFEGGAA